MSHHVILYDKPGCHLCESIAQILQRLRSDFEFDLQKVDITTDPDLLRKFQDKIPVVTVDGRKTLAAPIHVADLRAALASSS